MEEKRPDKSMIPFFYPFFKKKFRVQLLENVKTNLTKKGIKTSKLDLYPITLLLDPLVPTWHYYIFQNLEKVSAIYK